MIKFADHSTERQVWDMWKTVFGDPDNYMEIYFREKYKNENTLLYMVDNEAAASLQMLRYNFTFHGNIIPIAYLSGLCTLPEYRSRGYMKELIIRSYNVASERNIPLMLLVPQEEWLLNFYDKYGFSQTFDAGEEVLPSIKNIIDRNRGDLSSSYNEFNHIFNEHDMTVQKSSEDFRVIVEEASLFDFPAKRNLIGMARIIDAERLISIFAAKNPHVSIELSVVDELINENSASFTIEDGRVSRKVKSKNATNNVCSVDIRKLVRLLLGYHTSSLKEPFNTLFPKKKTQINLMME